MSRWIKWVVGAAVLGLAMSTGVAFATIPDSGGVIHGCYAKTKPRILSVINTAKTPVCPAGTVSLNWNQTGPAGPSGTGNAASNADTGGTTSFPVTLGNGRFTLVAATPNITIPGPSNHKLLLLGQFTVRETACSTSCRGQINPEGALGINHVEIGGEYSATLRNAGDTATISVSRVLDYGPGSYPAALLSLGSWPTDVTLKALEGSVQVIDLG